MNALNNNNINIAVVGIGYVGLPVSLAFSEFFNTVGFDVNKEKIAQLMNGIDASSEHSVETIKQALHKTESKRGRLTFSFDEADLRDRTVFILALPTPVNDSNIPDMTLLKQATEMVANYLKVGDTVIYESTVYPGATEELCVPILEKQSGLRLNHDFGVGYSPERVSPGDKNTFADIIKVTSGSNESVANFVDNLYKKVVTAGTFKASSIRVAEAAKVLENTQRDVNIALMNELSVLFNKMNINGKEVIEAAKTKWNFLPFTPGLVGGHCIGVDPYYLIHKSHQVGCELNLVQASRSINDKMGYYIADQVLLLSARKGINIGNARALILGLTYKENSRDVRNSKVIDIYHRLKEYGMCVDIHDPMVNAKEVCHEYQVEVVSKVSNLQYDVIIVAVAHKIFTDWGLDKIKQLAKKQSVIYDVKNCFNANDVDGHL